VVELVGQDVMLLDNLEDLEVVQLLLEEVVQEIHLQQVHHKVILEELLDHQQILVQEEVEEVELQQLELSSTPNTIGGAGGGTGINPSPNGTPGPSPSLR
jgi:hypothetical protein